jgi:hypothetical protein
MDPSSKYRGQKVGFHPIVSFDGLYDCLIHLIELFRIAGTVAPVDVAGFELVRPSDFSEWPCQSMEAAPYYIDNVSCQRLSRWSRGPCSDTPLIFNDVEEVIVIKAVFSHVEVLGDAMTHIIVSQATVATN